MSPDIFISYSREDQQQVVQLVEYLRGQGLSVWMDETDIHGATIWTKEIVEAIRACTLFILAISGHSTGSKNVVKELALASEREKIILPIYLEQCEIPETMEYQLAGIQNIALYTLDKAKAYEFVHQTIRRLGVGQASEEGQALGQAAAAPYAAAQGERLRRHVGWHCRCRCLGCRCWRVDRIQGRKRICAILATVHTPAGKRGGPNRAAADRG